MGRNDNGYKRLSNAVKRFPNALERVWVFVRIPPFHQVGYIYIQDNEEWGCTSYSQWRMWLFNYIVLPLLLYLKLIYPGPPTKSTAHVTDGVDVTSAPGPEPNPLTKITTDAAVNGEPRGNNPAAPDEPKVDGTAGTDEPPNEQGEGMRHCLYSTWVLVYHTMCSSRNYPPPTTEGIFFKTPHPPGKYISRGVPLTPPPPGIYSTPWKVRQTSRQLFVVLYSVKCVVKCVSR